jgi:uncharacterized protein YbjQ (UPF0145 family)
MTLLAVTNNRLAQLSSQSSTTIATHANLNGQLRRPKVHKVIVSILAFGLVSNLAQLPAGSQNQSKHLAQASSQTQQVLPGYVSNKGMPETTPSAAPITATAASSAASIPIDHRGYAASNFLATTTSVIEGYSILDYKGLVEGASVRVPTWSEDAAAGTREVYGGSIDSYAQLCEEARIQAFTTMVERAKKLGANAVIGIHFDSQVMPLDKGKFATGVVCVGTAVSAKHK